MSKTICLKKLYMKHICLKNKPMILILSQNKMKKKIVIKIKLQIKNQTLIIEGINSMRGETLINKIK
jgi:hypothetical protein